MRKPLLTVTLTLWIALAGTASATSVISLNPVGEHSCIAAPISLEPGESLAGVTWLNNDSTLPFPSLLLLEGLPGVPPDLDDVGLILHQVSGAELETSAVQLPVAVTSTTGFVWVVWVLPESADMTGLGDGEGPGIGLEEGAAESPFFVSGDGVTWMRWGGDQKLAVHAEILPAAARASVARASLAELAETTDYRVPEESGKMQDYSTSVTTMRLNPPSPNPFNPRTVLSFDLAQAGPVRINVYNVRGQLVRSLMDDTLPTGSHEIVWTGVDDRGKRVTSGVYFVRLEAAGREVSRRMTLVR